MATATAYGVSGIAVVRISGPTAPTIATSICTPKKGAAPAFPPRSAVYAVIHNQGTPVDEAIVTAFVKPHSYTGENLIEIACHGNPVIAEAIIAEACRFGARIAEPGEFTRRAFINGKLDLVQAESVAGLIKAKTVESSHLNLQLLKGHLSDRLHKLRDQIISLTAEVEFELDISEDDLNPGLLNRSIAVVNGLIADINNLIATYNQGKLLIAGANVVIIGAPNVGKSTLLNTLSASKRAIVSSIPGTTRDTIDVPLILAGVPVNLVDTAGLRNTVEEVEQEGVRRTHNRIEEADLVLAVYEPPNFDQHIEFTVGSSIPLINVYNKVDTISSTDRNRLSKDKKDAICISAKTGTGLTGLKERIKTAMRISPALSGQLLLTTARQHQALSVCNDSLRRAAELLNTQTVAFELVSVELQEAIGALDQLLGKTTADDIINHIFSNFCVGK